MIPWCFPCCFYEAGNHLGMNCNNLTPPLWLFSLSSRFLISPAKWGEFPTTSHVFMLITSTQWAVISLSYACLLTRERLGVCGQLNIRRARATSSLHEKTARQTFRRKCTLGFGICSSSTTLPFGMTRNCIKWIKQIPKFPVTLNVLLCNFCLWFNGREKHFRPQIWGKWPLHPAS